MGQISFVFQTAAEIVFGRGKAAEAGKRVVAMGQRVLLVTGGTPHRMAWLKADIEQAGGAVTVFSVASEPDVACIEAGVAAARKAGVDVVVSAGGGSVIDAGKAIAALVAVDGPVTDYLEVIGTGRKLEADPLPFVAIPTTSGTGAEVTKNAVVGVPEHRRKVSLRDPRMLANLALVDPALTDNSPRAVTLASGLDAITQLIEPYISSKSTVFTDALCRDALPRGLQALKVLVEREDLAARDALAYASLCGGLALANAGLGVVHGLAGPLGGLADAPHGAICGVLLPHAIAANRKAVTDPAVLARIDEVISWIAEAFSVSPDAALETLADWSRAAGLPSLSAMGIDRAAVEAAAEAAPDSSSMKANPVALDRATLIALMKAAG